MKKSSGGVHSIWMDMFNGFIDDTTLIKIKRLGSTFTWTNKQKDLVMNVLDYFFCLQRLGTEVSKGACEIFY
jgi:hypothetical protein